MEFKCEYIYEDRQIELMGEESISLDLCHRIAELMPQVVKIEKSAYNEGNWHNGQLYKATTHIFHPDEMQKIYNTLLELKNLELTTFEIDQRIREIADILGFINKNKPLK